LPAYSTGIIKFEATLKRDANFSLAVTVKMNILLFAPALFFILLFSVGPYNTLFNLAICAAVQILTGLEFLCNDPLAYLGRAFELGRVFQYRWVRCYKRYFTGFPF
jgi:alpha-1,3-mannosyltransferase